MRLVIILIILLSSAICSCRSKKQTVQQSEVTVSVDSTAVKESVRADEILSIIKSTTDFDIEGITVEFYPPDTIEGCARASPKTLTVESIKSRLEDKVTRHETVNVAVADSSNVVMHRLASSSANTKSDRSLLRASDIVAWLSIVISAVIIAFFIYNKFKRK